MQVDNSLYGFHSVKTALLQLPQGGNQSSVLHLIHHKKNNRIDQITALAGQKQVTISYISKKEMDQLSQFHNHQGVVLLLNSQRTQVHSVKNEQFLENLLHSDNELLLLILDGVQDPHNLGACLRTANAAAVDAVIIPKDKAVSLTPVVKKIACGAHEYTDIIQVTNIARTIAMLKAHNVWIIGTAGESESSLYDTDLKGNIALVIGSEEKGMRRLTREKCDYLIKIPMYGDMESLNLSVAAGVCLFEAMRQRKLG